MDDTDSTKGMCTTYLTSEIMAEFSEVDMIGYPRLVRLNPNIPWKTRGNGAISLRLGKGLGKRFVIGEIAGKRYYGYERGRDTEIEDVKFVGGIAVGVATDEAERQGVDEWKRSRLISAGADVIIPDFREY